MLGWAADQFQVVQPSPSSWVPMKRPLDGAARSDGTEMCRSTRPGSAKGLSMQGQKMSQPSGWTAVAIHGCPSGVVAQTKPPSQGACGATRGWPA